MSNRTLIQKIEQLSMNALPALETKQRDGWILRFANGYTKRANSIHPLYRSSEEVEVKMKACEQLYHDRELHVVYKITPTASPSHLDDYLDSMGYTYEGETSVQVLLLDDMGEKPEAHVVMNDQLNDKWLDHYCHFNRVSIADQLTLKNMLEKIVPQTCYMLLTDEKGNVCSCGLGVLEGEYIGLFDIVTNEQVRKQGYGTKLIKSLLHWGKKHGACYAYLQVVLENVPALKLYSKLGFKEVYMYWYRVK
ncbi:GNAT family N-acetyltransferase [Halalkalibacterium halodurans]|uniref:GNAT family N-acetyltransferase n=1 Tax=Halalkalibacterium halodurans TaxID=86665 RepID=UPI002AA9AEFC|nr:GNAT family N-acetyltransferase [Halalkalibacterium halodurans]MDY7221223.1 GNAT family N-acetyltransferase [Halalkalibacterium halodurans]MDY7240462.1 GNAT family N-acetyltransferase [Halalkalibacterium halodurans]